jgi:hypothetical protein
MPAAVYILFGAFFTIAGSLALGSLLLRWLSLKLYRQEEWLFSFLAGSGLLSLVVFCLAASHLLLKGTLVAVGVVVIGFAVWKRSYRFAGPPLPPMQRSWAVLFWVPYVFFGLLYFFSAMAPEHSPDGITYHLGLVSRYYREHGFVGIGTNMYASLSQGLEMLFLFAYAFGRHSAAAMVHCAFLLAFPLLMLAWARRHGLEVAGVTGALLVYLSPVVGITGTSAYNDVAAAVVVFAVFYLLEIWSEERDERLLVLIGLLAGYCYALKYPAGFAIVYAVIWVAWKSRSIAAIAIVSVCSVILVVPWMAKNAVLVGNPIAPFGNRFFPNPYILPGDEANYAHDMRTFNDVHPPEIPIEVTVGGQRLGGIVGPAFLLLPLSLLALRWRKGRILVLTAVFFSATYFTNISTRFLIQSLPFWSLALGMVVTQVPPAAVLLILAHGLASWPPFMARYAAPYAWRLDRIPYRPALRLVPEERYLVEKSRGYILARMVEHSVPQGEPVFSFGGTIAEAYTTRECLVGFQAALNYRIRDLLHTPLIPEIQPTRWLDFKFAPQTIRKVRLVQTAGGGSEYWSVGELRLYSGDRELPRAPEWRLTARPNPGVIQSAFDNSPVTRWRSGESIRPGMYIEVDLGKAVVIDRVRAECSRDQYKAAMKVDVLDAPGTWTTVAMEPQESNAPGWAGLRRAATAEVKALGVSYILIEEGDFGARDYIDKAPLWGWRQVDEIAGAHLFHIE